MKDKIVIIGAGVSGINAATTLVDGGYPGELITIIDKGKDPYNRLPEEVMEGMLGAGGWSDGKLVVSTTQGGQLSKYCGEEKATQLMDEVVKNFTRFHPDPSQISVSDPTEEPDFIKPYFTLRMSKVWHIGSNYLHEISKNWYKYLVDKGVKFGWGIEVTKIDFENKDIYSYTPDLHTFQSGYNNYLATYDKLIFGVGKSGIDLTHQLVECNNLFTEPKSAQIGVRFEAPQKYFQKLIDVAYDFKLYQKPTDDVSIRTFCTNNNAAFVAVEETYGDISYNGHAKKGEQFRNDMTNFGILMEIKGIENPFEWSRAVVSQNQKLAQEAGDHAWGHGRCGLFYSPLGVKKRPSKTSEGNYVKAFEINHKGYMDMKHTFKGYYQYIEDFIISLNQVFGFDLDYGIYIPEVKYLSPEPLVNYKDLSLNQFPNIHFVGDALSARGITVSGAQGIYVAEDILENQ